MKKHLTALLGISILSICLIACGWKPEVQAVPITAPWSAMNLPVKENAVVWGSSDKEFKAVHKEDRATVTRKYTDALKGQGWELSDFKDAGHEFTAEMKKGAEQISLRFYDFNNTGVIIEKQSGGDEKTGGKTSANPTENKIANPKIEKADFTVTSEELDKEFTKKGAKEDDLTKYASKNIAVSGRVSMLVTEKKGTTQPWVTLYAPGILGGVNCYFDDENVEQMKRLKMDKMAKVQGFKDSFIVPEVSPTLDHCVVLEAGN